MKSRGYLVPKLICFLLVNLFILNAGAQIATTVYCTKKGQETKRNDSAYFSRTIVPMADQAMSYFKIEEHYLANNAIKLIGTAQDTGVIIKFVGKLQEFYDNGGKKSVKNYNAESFLVDSAFYWYPNGKLKTVSYYPLNEKVDRNMPFYIAHYDSLGNRTLENGNGFIRIEYDDDNYQEGKMTDHHHDGKWQGIVFGMPTTEVFNKGKFLFGVKIRKNDTAINYDSTTYMVNPEYPGGMSKLMKFVSKHYRFPKEAKRNNVKGTLEISFLVNQDGYLEDIAVKKDLGFGTGAEGVRVLKMAERWKPGISRGEPIRVMYTMPIRLNSNP